MPITDRKLRVFLCHSSADRPIVRELYQRLRGEGWLDPWLDIKKLLPGQEWRIEIEQAVDAADIVVICLSNNSVDKEGFIQKELRYAREIALEKPDSTLFLIPLRLETCDVPRGLRFVQWADYFGEDKEQNYESLLESLGIRHQQVIRREEERARKDAEELERREKEEKVRKEIEEQKKRESDELARRKAEDAMYTESQEKARIEAEERVRKEVEEKARILREEHARKETKERARLKELEKLKKEDEYASEKIVGYLPSDTPPWGAMLSLAFQQVLTMFPATVLVAILTKFDVGVTLLASGLGTIIALLVSGRRIPMYYGSSFSYISVVITAMTLYANDCFSSSAVYCPEGVRMVQVGIIGTAVVEILIGLLIMRIGKEALDKALPPVITGSMAIVIGVALAGAALGMAGANWLVAFITLIFTVAFSVYLQGKGLIGMLPILLGAVVGYIISIPMGLVNFDLIANEQWIRVPNITLPAFTDPRAWTVVVSISLIAIATIPESTAHLYQMSLYIDALAKELKKAPVEIKKLIGLNLIADGADDVIVGFLGGCAGTNYGENNSLMAITRNYSVPVLMVAGVMAILLGFIGKLAALVNTIPVAVTGGLAIYLFGVIGMQGVALIQSEKVNLFEPRQLAVGATILICGIGGNLALPNGIFPFVIPVLFPSGIPAIVFAAIVGILMNTLFLVLPPSLFGVKERENINL